MPKKLDTWFTIVVRDGPGKQQPFLTTFNEWARSPGAAETAPGNADVHLPKLTRFTLRKEIKWSWTTTNKKIPHFGTGKGV